MVCSLLFLARKMDGNKMEFHEYVARYRLIAVSRIVLAVWGIFFLLGALISIPSFESLGGYIVVMIAVVLALGSVIVAVLISIAVTIGAIRYLPKQVRSKILFRLWIIPFAAAIYFLAMKRADLIE